MYEVDMLEFEVDTFKIDQESERKEVKIQQQELHIDINQDSERRFWFTGYMVEMINNSNVSKLTEEASFNKPKSDLSKGTLAILLDIANNGSF